MAALAAFRPTSRTRFALSVFLLTLALLIHFILLGAEQTNWIEGPRGPSTTAAQNAPLPAPAPAR